MCQLGVEYLVLMEGWSSECLEMGRSQDQSGTCGTNSRSGPGTSLGPVVLTVRVVLGPVWGP